MKIEYLKKNLNVFFTFNFLQWVEYPSYYLVNDPIDFRHRRNGFKGSMYYNLNYKIKWNFNKNKKDELFNGILKAIKSKYIPDLRKLYEKY